MAPQESNPWELAQEKLKKILDDHSYKNWFSQTQFESCQEGRIVVGVPSQFFADWLKDHYMDAISNTLRSLMPDFAEVRFVSMSEGPPEAVEQTPSAPKRDTAPRRVPRQSSVRVPSRAGAFNPRYTFERFVVGADNRFAHAAAKAVAERPSRAYNPLFLYGGTGLGKTHLMQLCTEGTGTPFFNAGDFHFFRRFHQSTHREHCEKVDRAIQGQVPQGGRTSD